MSTFKIFKQTEQDQIIIMQDVSGSYWLNYNSTPYTAQMQIVDGKKKLTLGEIEILQNTLSILNAASRMCLNAPQNTDPLYCAIEEFFKIM